MRILTWNICGWRSVCAKGFANQIAALDPDMICLQECRSSKIELPISIAPTYKVFLNPDRFRGTAVLSKVAPRAVHKKLGHARFDSEGRFLRLDFPHFILLNVHIPHGGRQKQDLKNKLKVFDVLVSYLTKLADQKVIVAGDFNVAHTPLDLARPKQNENNIMFTAAERAKIDELLDLGFVDAFRLFNGQPGCYTWWLRAFNARQRNIGWRIDYIFVSKPLARKLKSARILPEVHGSDHAPVEVVLSL